MIYFLLGLISGAFITMVILEIRKKLQKPQGRRGLLVKEFSFIINNDQKEDCVVSFEVMEIDRSSDKSKLKVLEFKVDMSKYNDNDWREKIREKVNNSWEWSNKIDWLFDEKTEERDKKLTKILGK